MHDLFPGRTKLYRNAGQHAMHLCYPFTIRHPVSRSEYLCLRSYLVSEVARTQKRSQSPKNTQFAMTSTFTVRKKKHFRSISSQKPSRIIGNQWRQLTRIIESADRSPGGNKALSLPWQHIITHFRQITVISECFSPLLMSYRGGMPGKRSSSGLSPHDYRFHIESIQLPTT